MYTKSSSYTKTTCTACSHKIIPILSLGEIPVVNYFPSKKDIKTPEIFFPLTLCLCMYCGLAQLNEVVNQRKLFSTYHYSSSTSSPLVEHLTSLAKDIIKRFNTNQSSKVLDIGCNDGILLTAFKKTDAAILGIDPAKNIARVTKVKNIPVVVDFFTEKLAEKVKKRVGTFDLIFATNTVSQIEDTNDLLKGVRLLLSENGVFIVEVGYIVDMLSKQTFDSIYHEHIYYYSFSSMQHILEKNGLTIFDGERIANHGGSIRLFITHNRNRNHKKTKKLLALFAKEKRLQLRSKSAYKTFVKASKRYKSDFLTLLKSIKKQKKSIVGIGAPAKGVVVLNYCGINNTILDYVTDSTPFKQNRFIPGVKIPVYSEEKLKEKTPDFLLLLAWTYKYVMLKKLGPYRGKGVKIIVPFPKIHILK